MIEDILKRFQRTDAYQRMEREVSQEELATRKALAARLVEIERQDAEGVKLAKAAHAAAEKRIAAEAALQAAKEAEATAIGAWSAFSTRISIGIADLESKLRATASPAIDIAIRELDRHLERARQTWAADKLQDGPANEDAEVRRRRAVENWDEHQDLIKSLAGGIRELHALKLKALTQEQLTAGINDIRIRATTGKVLEAA